MSRSLTMERLIPAEPEAVWRAWTTETGLASWWWHTWPDTRYRVDAVAGGSYRIEAAEHGIGVRGTYRVVEPPRRLAFSWIWYELRDGSAVDEPEDEVEVTFEAGAAGTRVLLRHVGPWSSDEAAANYRQGWDFVLDALSALGAS